MWVTDCLLASGCGGCPLIRQLPKVPLTHAHIQLPDRSAAKWRELRWMKGRGVLYRRCADSTLCPGDRFSLTLRQAQHMPQPSPAGSASCSSRQLQFPERSRRSRGISKELLIIPVDDRSRPRTRSLGGLGKSIGAGYDRRSSVRFPDRNVVE